MKRAYVDSLGEFIPPPTPVADSFMGEPEPEGQSLPDDTEMTAGDIETAVHIQSKPRQSGIDMGASNFESAYCVLELDQPGLD